ncbi:hypothetical protein RI444_22950 (plasmid) [Paenarthrobacter sp. AT5]|uniref:hypothetical protein n=1 Tax=Paenarthrobacter sp. AT5 TaxID=2973089 RepID=UPI002934DD46|nr:hypothetical protein [Paenarthrobacter sp. AT5]WOC63420.1 hypothetical protein RI444_22950 [Paenarthrobacter sp. AT5]
MSITVYTITDETGRECSNCSATKKAMDRQRITYQVKEMTAMERDTFRQAGHMAAPSSSPVQIHGQASAPTKFSPSNEYLLIYSVEYQSRKERS